MKLTTIACILANMLIIIGCTGGFHGWKSAYKKVKENNRYVRRLDYASDRMWEAYNHIFLIAVFIFVSFFVELTNN